MANIDDILKLNIIYLYFFFYLNLYYLQNIRDSNIYYFYDIILL